MIEPEHRNAHWNGTKANAAIAIGILVGILLLGSSFARLFSYWSFLGFPFSFFLAAQGALILMIILVYWSSGRQEKTDRRHGASEEI